MNLQFGQIHKFSELSKCSIAVWLALSLYKKKTNSDVTALGKCATLCLCVCV